MSAGDTINWWLVLPACVSAGVAVLLLGVATLQWIVATGQWTLAERKLKADLFDRRFDVFQAAFDFLEKASFQMTTIEDKDRLISAINKGKLLFASPRVPDYLKGVLDKVSIMEAKADLIRSSQSFLPGVEAERDRLNEWVRAQRGTLADEFSELKLAF